MSQKIYRVWVCPERMTPGCIVITDGGPERAKEIASEKLKEFINRYPNTPALERNFLVADEIGELNGIDWSSKMYTFWNS